ncbi:serine/threonine-protein phosphatase 6 regulatory ankyrin repeat subunit C-like [Haliotis rubra]|uniref:serine/threonine-protein phosphatase 6 regulatory ankyrin repeat subunit C-like n=1 Tax=Haliotis rubra TaxID=36100 RepID=UPI001EE5DB7A|nr:serine/threonine-protein phosphatase 6 regulatory ankyrin repeat subunit C-like [Haliotis rubra]
MNKNPVKQKVGITLPQACEQGKLDTIRVILTQTPEELHFRGVMGRTPVMVAAATGQKDALALLIRQGSDLSLLDDDGENILHLACTGGNVEAVKIILLQKAVAIDSRGKYGQTSVMIAAYYGHTAVYDLLESKKCSMKILDDRDDNILHVACLGGKVDMVRHILSQRIFGIETRGQFGQTALMKAARMGHSEVFDVLLENGSDFSVVDYDGDNILHVACLSDDVDLVTSLLMSKRTLDLECRGQYGRTALMKAAEKGHRGVYDLLVSKGSNVSVLDDDGNNVLHVACCGGDVHMVKHVLCNKQFGIEDRGKFGRTPLMMAAEKGNIRVFDSLISRACDFKALDFHGYNVLHVACFSGNIDMVSHVLTKTNIDIESKGQYGRTPLMASANKGHRGLFEFLVTKGSDVSAVDDDGNNVLHVACQGGSLDMVKYIISQKIFTAEIKDKLGRTPVMHAAYFGQREVFEYLVSKGCSLSVIDKDGDTVLHMTCYGGRQELVQAVLSRGVVDIESKGKYGRTPVMTAADFGHMNIFDFLVSKGCDLSVVDANGDNILHVACYCGNVDMVKHLLSQKVCGIESRGKYGRTPIMTAAFFGRVPVFELLLDLGADLSVADDDGDNILHVACLGGNVAMVEAIVSKDVLPLESRGTYRRTPVMHAANKGHTDVVDLLVRSGCDLSVMDSNKDNILHVAAKGGSVDVLRYILSQNVLDIDAKGQYGQTALLKAARTHHKNVVDLLLSEGCSNLAVDNYNNNILHVACLGGNMNMVTHIVSLKIADLESRGKHGRTGLMMAAEKGHIPVFDFLVSEGSNMKTVDDDRDNILHLACFYGSEDMVNHILALGAISIESKGQYGQTPLMKAAASGHRHIFDLLVSKGCNTSFVNADGDNVLHVACLGGNVDMVNHVIASKIGGLESKGKYGQTPVMKAASMGHKGVFVLLVSKECDLKAVDNDGDSIIHVACYGGNLDIVKYLITLHGVVDINKKNKAGKSPLQVAETCGYTSIVEILKEDSS